MTEKTPQKPIPKKVAEADSGDRYENLDPDHVLKTIQVLQKRISERFSSAGLAQVCEKFLKVSEKARSTSQSIAQPMWGLRIFTYSVIVLAVMLPVAVFWESQWAIGEISIPDLITLTEALLNDLILIGAAILFLVTVENRVKRERTLKAIHKLRSIAHIVDMHQLTKDPEKYLKLPGMTNTASSPKQVYTQYELGRYLDYCSEMLSLIGKVGAMYIENFPDGQAVQSVNELESLTTGLSRKIWQKIMILNSESFDDDSGS